MTDSLTHVTFIPIEQLLEMIENKESFTLVDVLDADQYEQGHLPGAVSLPSDTIETNAATILPDKKKQLVTYCASYMCHASTEAARKLKDMGYKNVYDYKAGKKGWTAAGMPIAR